MPPTHEPPAAPSAEAVVAKPADDADAGAGAGASAQPAVPGRSVESLRTDIVDALHTVYDPEIPVDIYELGLIYKVEVQPTGDVYIEMTLTSPACPVAGTLPPEVQEKVASVDGVTDVRVEVVWDPPWEIGMMSDEARLSLGFM